MTRTDRYRLLWRYARPQGRHLIALTALAFAPAALLALQPLALKLLVDNGLSGRPLTGFPAAVFDTLGISDDPRSIIAAAAFLAVGTAIASVLVTDPITLYWEWVGARMVREGSRDVFDCLQRLSPLHHARTATGDSLSTVTTDASALYTATSAILVAPAMHIATLVTVTWAAWRLVPSLAMVALLLGPVLALVSRWFNARLKRRAVEARRERVAITSFVTNVVRSLPLVQAFTAEAENMATFRDLTDQSNDSTRRTVTAQASADSVETVVGAVGVGAILVIGGRGVIDGTVTLGDLLVFLAYVRTMDGQFRALLRAGRQVRVAEVGLDRMNAVLLSDVRVPEPSDPVEFPDSDGGSSIVMDGVTFGYDDGTPVVHDIDLTVNRGETIAVVGRTGAGKSTLTSLICRLVDPWAGRVEIDGVDVRTVAVAEARRRVAIVRQDPLILPISVAENIAIGRPDATRPEIERAAAAALADEFIPDLPDGYETVLIENGSALSGGQRQRLALARAFLKDAPILILDEPTSALDPESESSLVESVQRESDRRTVVVVAHRLATVRRADRVIVLEDGRIVEQGTHDELVDFGGVYAQFHWRTKAMTT